MADSNSDIPPCRPELQSIRDWVAHFERYERDISISPSEKVVCLSKIAFTAHRCFPVQYKLLCFLEECISRLKLPLDSHRKDIERILDSSMGQFTGVWIMAFKIYHAAGEFRNAREMMERSFQRTSRRQHAETLRTYFDFYAQTLPVSNQMMVYLLQRAITLKTKYVREFFYTLKNNNELNNALGVLLHFKGFIHEDPCKFVTENSSLLDYDKIKVFLDSEKKSKPTSERLQVVYNAVLHKIAQNNSLRGVAEFIKSELSQCMYDIFPFLCTKYIEFLESWKRPDQADLIKLYEEFISTAPIYEADALLRLNPADVRFHCVKMKYLAQSSELLGSHFSEALAATKKSDGCESIWIRYAFWNELHGNIQSAHYVYQKAMAELNHIPLERYTQFCLTYTRFLLRQGDVSDAIRLMRRLTATNKKTLHHGDKIDADLNEKKTWTSMNIWNFYLHICKKYSKCDAVAMIFERMIQLDLGTSDIYHEYLQYIKDQRMEFGTRYTQIHRKAITKYPRCMKLWQIYLTHESQCDFKENIFEKAFSNFLSSCFPSILSLENQPVSTQIEVLCRARTQLLVDSVKVLDLQGMYNIMAMYSSVIEVNHGSSLMSVLVLRLFIMDFLSDEPKFPDRIHDIKGIFSRIYHQKGIDFANSFINTVKTDIRWTVSQILSRNRNLSEELFILGNILIDIATSQSQILCTSCRIAAARASYSSESEMISGISKYISTSHFWVDWLNFEKQYGTKDTIRVLKDAWKEVISHV